MGPSLAGVDVVHKGEHRLVIAVVVLDGNLNDGLLVVILAVFLDIYVNRVIVQDMLAFVDIADEVPDSAVEHELAADRLVASVIYGDYRHTAVEEGQFPEA